MTRQDLGSSLKKHPMTMLENTLKRNMVSSVKSHGGYARRIEDQYGVGIPDTVLIPKGLPVFFAEAKIISANMFGPTPRQYIELMQISQMGEHAVPLLVGWKDGVYYFAPPASSIDRRECFSMTDTTMSFHDQLVQYYHSTKGKK